MKKFLLAIGLVLTAWVQSAGQGTGITPPPTAGYTSLDGLTWNALTSTATTGGLAYTPPASVGLYGYNASTGLWYPCSTANPCAGAGGGGGSFTPPASGTLFLSNGTTSPAGIAPALGQCATGLEGPVWGTSTCGIAAQHVAGANIFLNMLPQYISGTTVSDVSGNGNNGTMCTTGGGTSPTSTTVGLVFASTSCIALPAGVSQSIRTLEWSFNIPATGITATSTVYLATPNSNSSVAPAYAGVNNTYPGGGNNITQQGAGLTLYRYGTSTPTSSPVFLSSGNHTIILTLGANSGDLDKIYFDGVQMPYTAQSYTAGSYASAGAYLYLGDNPTYFGLSSALVTEYEFIGFNAELTPAQVAQENAAMVADDLERGAGPTGVQWNSSQPYLSTYGDSLTACYPYPGFCWAYNTTFAANVPTFTLNDFGVVGKTTTYLLATGALNYPIYCAANRGPNIATVFDGTNDFTTNLSPSSVSQVIAAQVQGLVQNGCKVFVGTMINRGTGQGGTGNGLSWVQNQTQLDAIIRQNAVSAWGASGVIDFAANTNLGGSNANANTTYYQTDNTHLTNAGYMLMGNVWANVLNYYFGYRPTNPNFINNNTSTSIGLIQAPVGSVGTNQVNILSVPLTAGAISQIQMQFYAAPSGSSPITISLFNCVSLSCTPSGATFTVTPAATTALQTFVAGTGFTGAPAATTGQYIGYWASTALPGYYNSSPGFYQYGATTFPSGAFTVANNTGNSIDFTATTTLTTSSYQMTASDGYISYQGTAAYTFTLPDCTGQSGAKYTINNATGSSPQTITLKTFNSSETINGIDYSTTGLALPTTAEYSVTDVPVALGGTTTGCTWTH